MDIDYFTKWVEADRWRPYQIKQVQNFILRNIITRFGISKTPISDNERQFNSGPTREYYSRFDIQTRFSVVSRPQTNGQAEAANKIMLNGIKKSLEGAKGTWIDDLPGVLWSAQTTVKEATCQSPFSLVYGSEVVLLVEVGIPSPGSYEQNEKEKLVNHDLLPETRGNSVLKSIRNKQRVARQFNLRVKTRPIHVGDWVV